MLISTDLAQIRVVRLLRVEGVVQVSTDPLHCTLQQKRGFYCWSSPTRKPECLQHRTPRSADVLCCVCDRNGGGWNPSRWTDAHTHEHKQTCKCVIEKGEYKDTPTLRNCFLVYLKFTVLTVARGPSSMLAPIQGFQLGCGGDQDTTPPRGRGRDSWKSLPSTRCCVTRDTGSVSSICKLCGKSV